MAGGAAGHRAAHPHAPPRLAGPPVLLFFVGPAVHVLSCRSGRPSIVLQVRPSSYCLAGPAVLLLSELMDIVLRTLMRLHDLQVLPSFFQ